MRILELHLRAVGPFTDYSMDLSAGNKGLHIIYGPNEAGKSSALRALPYLFFGFPTQLDDSFLHAYPVLRVGARICNDQNEDLAFLRRKAAKNSLRGLDDATVIPDDTLRRFLGQIDQNLFKTFFGIDHPTLVRGGQEIVKGQGDVGKILFSGSGVAELHSVLKGLDNEMDALFLPSSRAKNPRLNDLLGKFDAARKLIRDKQLPHREWDEQRKSLENDLKRKEKADDELKQLSGERNRLERVQQALPLIANRADLLTRRAELAEVPSLPANFRDRRQAMEQKLRLAEAESTRASSAVKSLEQQLETLDVPESFLDERGVIEPISRRLGVYQQAQDDRPELDAELRRLEEAALQTLRKIDHTLELSDAASVEIPDTQRSRIRAVGSRYDAIAQQIKHWTSRTSELQTEVDRTQKGLVALPDDVDSTRLLSAVQQAMKLGDIESQLTTVRDEYESASEQLDIDLQQLPLWRGTAAELETIALPPAEAIERLNASLGIVDQELRDLRRDIQSNQDSAEELDRKIRHLRLEQDVPTEDELSNVRRRRQEAWTLIRRCWRDGETLDDEIQAFLESIRKGDAELVGEFEWAVERADDISDRLRREANRVTTLAELQAQRETFEERRTRLAARLADAEVNRQGIMDEWTSLWEPSGITPLLPREMLGWIRRQSEVSNAAKTVRRQHNEMERLKQRIAEHCAKVRNGIDEISSQPTDPNISLVGLLNEAERVLKTISETANSRKVLNRDLLRLEADLEGARGSVVQAERDLDDWQSQWSEATDGLPLKPDHGPAEAAVLLDLINSLSQQLRDANAARTRIGQIDASMARFVQYVSDLTARLSPDLAALAVDQAAAELYARFQKATTAAGQRDVLTTQVDGERDNLQTATTTIVNMRRELAAVCAEARCATAEELPDVERLSEEKQDSDLEIANLETQLRRLSAGQPLSDFVSYAQSIDADTIEPRMIQLDDEIGQRNRELKDELGERIGATKKVLEQMDSSAGAAEAAEDAQDLAARIARDAEEYARLKLASLVLAKAIERYRDAHQEPILKRSSQLFADLTVGSFSGLREDFDDNGRPELFGVRANDNEAVRVKHMSDGCADQLYLAVRLAWLEDYIDEHGSIPFIVDDILIRFDDDRAIATLKTLAELSTRTQVLFFTHNRHLVDIARQVLDEGTLFVHELPRNRSPRSEHAADHA